MTTMRQLKAAIEFSDSNYCVTFPFKNEGYLVPIARYRLNDFYSMPYEYQDALSSGKVLLVEHATTVYVCLLVTDSDKVQGIWKQDGITPYWYSLDLNKWVK